MIPLFRVFMSEDAPGRVAETLRSGYVGQGPRVDEFEAAFRAQVGAPRETLAVNSGTSALHLALTLCGVGPGDEVITTPMTCLATNLPILHHGATPVWADVNPRTGLIDPADVARKRTARTKAIVAVDWGGHEAQYRDLRDRGVPVIQDAAHGFSPMIGGDYTCWSFQAIKWLTTGDGGALLCPDDATTDRARRLRWFGLDRRSSADFRCAQDVSEAGYKFQMNDVAASIGLANLDTVTRRIDRALENAKEIAANIGDQVALTYSLEPWLLTLLVPHRDAFVSALRDRGVQASPVHARNDRHTLFAPFRRELPGVDAFASRNVAIPCGWWLTAADRRTVIHATRAALRETA